MSYSVSRTVIKEGTHCRPNIGNFDRFSKRNSLQFRLCKWRFCKSSTQSRCGTATYAKPADLRTYFLSLVKVFSVCRKLTRVMKMTAFKLF